MSGTRHLYYQRRYHVQAKLGRALYGDVYLCQDTYRNDNSLLAIKQINIAQARRALASNRCLDNPVNEQRVIAMLDRLGPHENILQYMRHFVERGSLFIVMEYCNGGDLLDVVHASPEGRLRESVALHYFRQIVSGVHFLHRHGVAHRDLSLENALLQADTVKLCDFGLSTEVDRVCSEAVGKAYYMAPEVVAKESYDPAAADMWSLGMMLFILLTGSPLVALASTSDKSFSALQFFGVRKILQAWGLASSISEPTTRLLESLLSVDPTERMSIDQVEVDLMLDGVY